MKLIRLSSSLREYAPLITASDESSVSFYFHFQVNWHSFHKNIVQHTVFNIDNNQKCFLSSNQHIRMYFWRSCDTEDWSNDAIACYLWPFSKSKIYRKKSTIN